jgi:hypothetical protein
MMALDVEKRLDCWNFETASGLPSEVSDIKTRASELEQSLFLFLMEIPLRSSD